MKALQFIARVLVGMLFIFSGYVKAIDPMGSAIKFGDYFEAFGMHAFIPAALAFGILLAVAEVVLGLCLFLNIRMKEAAWGALLFMLFFTCLTFVLAVFNPVEDCGCFGDAIKLTNWETFYKNLIILPFVIFIFWQRKNYKPFVSCKTEWAFGVTLGLACVALSIYTYRHLPLIDFMGYKVGVNLPEAMVMPEDAPQDEYEYSFIYEKGGVKKEIGYDDLSLIDSTWTHVETKTKLLKEGYTPPAKDFSISSETSGYITDSVLSIPGNMMFITSYNLADINENKMAAINSLYDYCQQNNIFLCLLSGSSDDVNADFVNKTNAKYPIFHTDETVLKSMVRSNPGIILLKDAVILKKWHINDIPTVKEIQEVLSANTQTLIDNHYSCEKNTTRLLMLFVFVLFGISLWLSYSKNKK